MLDDVLGAFLNDVTEREFDAPFGAMLGPFGYRDVHYTHGSFEFGKDFIAKFTEGGQTWQVAFQNKTGDLNLDGWREVKLQLEQIRTNGLAYPGFDRNLPRTAVLAVTGRLAGAAATDAQEYEAYVRSQGARFEAWDRPRLIEMLAGAPELGLSGGLSGAVLSLLGAIDEGRATDRDIEQYGSRWFSADLSVPRLALEAAVIGTRCRARSRLDLAALAALAALRAIFVRTGGHGEDHPLASPVREMFATFADTLLRRLGPQHLQPEGVVREHPREFGFFLTYPVRVLRTAEILSLHAIRLKMKGSAAAVDVEKYVLDFVSGQPGTSHPISDRWAVSLIPIAVLLASHGERLVDDYLREVVRWTADRYDKSRTWGLGLAGYEATPREEIDNLLGGPLEHVKRERRDASYVMTVVLDLCAILSPELYGDALNDFLAVDARPIALELPDDPAQFGGPADELRYHASASYPETLQKGARLPAHHRPPDAYGFIRAGHGWDALAISSLARDRHWPAAMRAVAESIGAQVAAA